MTYLRQTYAKLKRKDNCKVKDKFKWGLVFFYAFKYEVNLNEKQF